MEENSNPRWNYNNVNNLERPAKQSLSACMNKFVQAVDSMDSTVMIPSRLRDMDIEIIPDTNNSQEKAVIPVGMEMNNTDLLSCYRMLNAVKNELVRGPGSLDTDADDETENMDEQSKQTAKMFRHHLSGLFNVLHQLTDAANYLTTRYQDAVLPATGNASLHTSGISSFAL
ncbi:mid1-interacting protein 1-B-like [Lingula anatina]|uniref:Mid1-interacting protein 1-B-like n=1 Tax=Lingula anatina TaxID=7574 RepID=A0A1S3I586_LINAN|nr:mid1-interacting protein 1-B-like [Lingula anatina]|eukprot:XP_013416399.1 mid1-interacting protein 1-B-like [Lingula anatina]